LSKAEKLATIVGIVTSLATLLISIIELPKNPVQLNAWIALVTSLAIAMVLLFYWFRAGKKRSAYSSGLEWKKRTEENRLRSEFPAIFTFIENVGVIHNKKDFDRFIAQLNHLLEIERRARGIKWSEVKDIETMKAIAYAKLISKKDKIAFSE